MKTSKIKLVGRASLVIAVTFVFLIFCNTTSIGLAVSTNQVYRVHNLNTGFNYTTIQAAVNNSTTQDGHVISVDSGTYFEHLIVTKSLKIVGAGMGSTIINGNGTGTAVSILASNVTFEGFAVKNATTGILLYRSNNSTVASSKVTLTDDAVMVRYSNSCRIYGNVAGDSQRRGNRGIFVTNSRYFNVSDNQVSNNEYYGINANSSMTGVIVRNSVFDNGYDGIGLFDSSNCEVVANNVTDNNISGILLDHSSGNLIYHNNLVGNYKHAASTSGYYNAWDDGNQGNYWSNYTGIDANHDGIGDTSYTISTGNVDSHPLMNKYIIPEYSLAMFLAIFLLASLSTIYLRKKRLTKSHTK